MSERERTRAGMLVQRSDTAYRQTRRKTSRRVLLPLLDGALRQRHGHARLQYTESNRRLQRHESSGHGMESKRGGYWLQPHWNSRTWHDATTTTMTPIGFPLARYSHHAPREGRSLSTAARTGSTPARASTRCYPSRGLLHEIVSREGSHTRLSLERASTRDCLSRGLKRDYLSLRWFQRRFLRNSRVSSSTYDGTIRGTQYGIGGRRSIRTLMRWEPSET
jgi:hypothetical protein